MGDYYISLDYFENKMKGFEIFPQDIIVSCAGTIGETFIMPDKFERGIINQALMKMRISTHIYPAYFLLYFDYVLKKYSIDKSKGSAIKNIPPFEIFKEYFFPIPPINEQREIVEKIEKINPLITNYETNSNELNTLNSSYKEELKKSVLQYAIQGKLVPQNANDESADILISNIIDKKRELIKTKQIKKENLSVIYKDDTDNQFYEKFDDGTIINITDEISIDIPYNWKWTRLKNIVYNHGQKKPDTTFSYIDIGTLDNINYKLNENENIVEANQAPSRARKIVKKGDILYSTVRPYLHNICIVDKDFSKEPIASTGFAVLTCLTGIYNKYLFYLLLTPFFDGYANSNENAKGVAYPAINDKKLYKALIPIPPTSEQKNIVDKLEKVFNIIG